MSFVTKDNTSRDNDQLPKYVAFASDIGIAPGHFPNTIDTNLGNGLQFVAVGHDVEKDELLSVSYKQGLGCVTLLVFND